MTHYRFLFRIVAAASLLAACADDPATWILNQACGQDSSQFEVFELTTTSATEARRMLIELLGAESRRTQVIANDERFELVVSGSAKSRELARQLVQKLNAAAPAGPAETQALQLKSYSCLPGDIDQKLREVKAALSPSAGVSADRKGARIVVAANADEQLIAERILKMESHLESAAPLFAGAGNWESNDDKETTQTAVDTRRSVTRAVSQESTASGEASELPRLPSFEEPSQQKTFAFPAKSFSKSNSTDFTLRFRFRNISVKQAETAMERLLGDRIVVLSPHRLNLTIARRREVMLTFDELSASCLMEGSKDIVLQTETLLRQLDDARDDAVSDTIRFVPLTNVDPEVLNRALLIWRQSNRTRKPTAGTFDEKQSRQEARDTRIRLAGFQQVPGEPPIPIESPSQEDSGSNEALPDPSADSLLRRPSSDVTVEPLPDLDVLILRGRDPDVEELTRIIREIERLSAEAAPEVEVVYLHNVQGAALEEVVNEVLDDLTGPLQGRVSVTPLVKPNALLLIGWGEAVNAAKGLIARLDESVEPQTQMQMFSLKHASVNQVEKTIRDFLNDRGGLGPEVNMTADPRTNMLIVNAAPRDMTEVERLIQSLDAGTSESINQARVIQLRNALAADVSQTITTAINAARGGTGTQRSAALEMLMVGPDGKSVAASGLLDDVKLTPDARTNRIFITGPPESVPLVEQLIKSLDESPAASAQIKVFQITNGDASDLVQVLRSLFPEQAAVSNVPQLATAEGESSLVPVRFSVDIRTNSIIATGTSGDLRIIEALLLRLDETDSQERVNEVYRLKNSPALDVANAVNNFLRSERVVNQAAPGRQNPFTQIESEVVVVPEPVGNALIISATPRYFEQIMELVEGLDAQPPQVMIQVILAEVELDNIHEFGVELGLQDSLLFDRSLLGSILSPGFDFNNKPLGNANTAGSLSASNSVSGQALSHFSLGRTSSDTDFGGLVLSASSENVSVLLRAMNQSRNMEILSRPQIMTLDNQPAFIQVGQRVPRITGTSINQVGQVNTVELENVGLILGVTPRISPEGMVVMEIDAEKSEVGPEIDGIPVSISADGAVIRSPRVNITTAQTTVSSASGQTIVIGGLITTSNTTLTRRVPWLSDVPVVGNLFRFDGNKNNRKELLIILTPHVVRGPSEAEYIKQVEMARMSWISCDIFNWMNTDTTVSGQFDSESVPTIYPDQTPGAAALQRTVPLNPSPDNFSQLRPGAEYLDTRSSADTRSAETRVVVPEWTMERPGTDDVDAEKDNGVKQMSFRSTSPVDAVKKPAASVKSDSIDSRTKTKERRSWFRK